MHLICSVVEMKVQMSVNIVFTLEVRLCKIQNWRKPIPFL